MLAGSVASMTVLGAPDLVLLTLSELAEQVRRISRAAAIPLMVDADHGYGNALNVFRTVEELEVAGASAITIEDTLLPAPFGGDDKGLIPVEEGVGKMRAAVAARSDPNLVIVARTSSASLVNVEDAVARGKAYEMAGADAVFFAGIKNREQLHALGALSRPILLGAVPPALSDNGLLAAHGVRVCLQGHRPFQAAVRAAYETLKRLSEGAMPAEITEIASDELMARVTRREAYAVQAKDFLGG